VVAWYFADARVDEHFEHRASEVQRAIDDLATWTVEPATD
jgi:hypothetical protein